MNQHLPLFLVSLLLAPALAQGHGPIGADPSGVVLDERLQPLAGATVQLVARAPTGAFARAMAAAIAGTPLPTTRSGRDGGYVLPLTDALRRLDAGAWSSSGLWLVVERDGYLPWREPLSAGTAHWLGSRVVLRAVRADDPFADLPWPPAVVEQATRQGFWAWLPLDGDPFPALHPPARVIPEPDADAPEPEPVRIELQVTANDRPVADASLWFDDGATEPQRPDLQLPTRTDAAGRAVAVVLGGGGRIRLLRVIAPGFVAHTETIPTDGNLRLALRLEPAQIVDLLAVDADGAPRPFAELSLVPHQRDSGLQSFTCFADANGRLRVAVAAPAAWFAYGERDTVVARIELQPAAADGIVRVPVERAITVRLRGDEWPRQGQLRWQRDSGDGRGRAFHAHPDTKELVVLRLASRSFASLTIGGDDQPPFVIRREDLPPPTAEPLLDLVDLDRRVRVRAKLQPVGAAGDPPLRFVVRPSWQAEDVRRGEEIRCSQQVGGQWLLRLRDDAPYDLAATAFRHLPLRFQVPAAIAGAEPPTLPLELQPK
ncbi:MAG: carboxypeptidase-like regulatory domain-containing protein [Planctomycetes bacterium]|jgi:hypothetical protein|nr:carboxypeptidase-like regulatory domain-containing protein [Planctomycetota bacterium]